MKSSVQQYVSIFLVVCLFVFFGIGIASDGFTDFEVFEPKPIAPSIATAEVEACSSEVGQSDTIDRITWENERVEYGFTLVSGDIDSDTGFSISEEGILTFTNFEYALSVLDHDYISDHEGEGYVSSTVSLEIGLSSTSSTSFRRLSFTRAAFEATGGSIDLVREICLQYIYIENLSFTAVHVSIPISFRKEDKSLVNTSLGFGNVRYRGYVNFFDRVDPTELYVKPNIEEGYIFDGWYTDPEFTNSSYYGSTAPSSSYKRFIYKDVAIDLYPKVSPAVTVSIDFGDEVKSIACAVGTSSLNSRSISRSKLFSLFRDNCKAGDEFYTESGIVLNSDMFLAMGESAEPIVDFIVDSDMTFYYDPYIKEVTVTFYNGDEVFYTCQLERGSALDMDLIPLPPVEEGYEFLGWQGDPPNVSGDHLYLYYDWEIMSDCSFEPRLELIYYNVTIDYNGKTTSSGETSITYKVAMIEGISKLALFSSDKKYARDYMVYADGRVYEWNSKITEDTTLYIVWRRIYATVTLFEGRGYAQPKVKTISLDEPYLLDMERDFAEFFKLGYSFVLYTDGERPRFVLYTIAPLPSATSSIRLYYEYELIDYTVKFFNDSTDPMHTTVCTCEDKLSLPEVESRAGYDFLGWFYEDGRPYEENTVVLSDLNLYAKWQIQRKTVTLMSAGEVQNTFEVDYGTSLDDVLKQINYQNYNVISFSADGFTDENCFVADVSFEVAQMDKQDSVINTLKNKWKIVVGIVAGVLLLVIILSVVPKSMKKYVRKRK